MPGNTEADHARACCIWRLLNADCAGDVPEEKGGVADAVVLGPVGDLDGAPLRPRPAREHRQGIVRDVGVARGPPPMVAP